MSLPSRARSRRPSAQTLRPLSAALAGHLEVPAAFLDRRTHLLCDLRQLARRLAERRTGHHDDLERGRGHHGRVAPSVLQETHLTEEIARPELGQELVAAPDLAGSLLDGEELVGPLALAHDRAPLLQLDLVGTGRQRAALLAVQACEQRHVLQSAFVHSLTSSGLDPILSGRLAAG